MSSPSRPYRGVSADERAAARRTALVEAALDLLGAADPRPVTMTAICERAGLTERYFYESFADRDALVQELYEQVAGEARQALEAATRTARDRRAVAEASVEAMVSLMVDDPRKGRVLLVAPVTEPVLASRVLEMAPVVASMIREQLSPGASEQDRDLISTGVLGALMSLFHGYLQGTLAVSREEFVAHCVQLLLTVDRLERRPR